MNGLSDMERAMRRYHYGPYGTMFQLQEEMEGRGGREVSEYPPKPVTPQDDPKEKFLAGLDLSFVNERAVRNGVCVADEVQEVEREFKRWFFLAAKYPEEQVALTVKLDNYWHTFIVYTLEYAEACRGLGGMIHHIPGNSRYAVPISDVPKYFARTLELYARHFGVPPRFWDTMVAGKCYSCCCERGAPKPKLPWF